MLTSAAMGTGIQFTLNHAFRIDPGVLPQHRELEDPSADATGRTRNEANPDTWCRDVRGETGFGRPCRRRSRDTGRVAMSAGSINVLTAGGAVPGISRILCSIVPRLAARRARIEPHRVPEARTAPMHGTKGRALLPHPRVAVSCCVSR